MFAKVVGSTALVAGLTFGGVSAANAAPTQAPDSTGHAAAATRRVSATSYADDAVRAFGLGSETGLAGYTTTAAREHMITSFGSTARAHWKRTAVSGAAGTVYVTYRNTETGRTMTLGVQNTTGLVAGTGHHVYRVL